MEKDLFRREAVASQVDTFHGEVLVVPSIHFSTVIISILTLVIAVSLWLYHSEYSRKEIVLGWIEPLGGVSRVYASRSGIIDNVLVEEGAKVAAGDPLVVIRNSTYMEGGGTVQSRLLDQYRSQKLILESQLVREESLYTIRNSQINESSRMELKELENLNYQRSIAVKRLDLAKKKSARYSELTEKRYISQGEIEELLSTELAISNEIKNIDSSIEKQKIEISRIKMEIDTIPDKRENSIDAIKSQINELDGQIARMDSEANTVIRAEIAGTVNSLIAKKGAHVLLDGVPLLTIIPLGSILTANILVPVSASGFIEVGQDVDIRYDAFPYQKFGLYSGKIVNISTSVSLPNEISNSPISIKQPAYRVVASLKDQSIKGYGRDIDLKPGMTFSASIKMEKRTLIQWILSPIYSLNGEL